MGSIKSSIRKVGIRTTMFLVYLFIGAGIFLGLEGKSSIDRYELNEKKYRSAKIRWKEKLNITETEFLLLENLIYDATKNGIVGNSYGKKWTFGTSFFFCGNVITTIGYGSIVPKTTAGRLVMMIYALLGIPLTGFFLRTVGNELTAFIAFAVKTYERRWYNREAERLELKCAIIASVLAGLMLLIGGALFTATEKLWNYIDGFYFSFVTLTTVGFGDLVPIQDNNHVLGDGERLGIELAFLIYYVLGLSIMSGVIVSISGIIEEKTKKLDVSDPMDALRNLRIENLNSKAMKKLGYKVEDDNRLPMARGEFRSSRRGTIVPEDGKPTVRAKVSENRKASNGTVAKNGKPGNSPTFELVEKTTMGRKQSSERFSVVAIESCDTEKKTFNIEIAHPSMNQSTTRSNIHLVVTDDSKMLNEAINGVGHISSNGKSINPQNGNSENLTKHITEHIFTNDHSNNNHTELNLKTQRNYTDARVSDLDFSNPHSPLPSNTWRKWTNNTLEKSYSDDGLRNRNRVGLPAALFANRVSMALNTPDIEHSSQNVGFYNKFSGIPMNSPKLHCRGYLNPSYQSTESLASQTFDNFAQRPKIKRRSSTGGSSVC